MAKVNLMPNAPFDTGTFGTNLTHRHLPGEILALMTPDESKGIIERADARNRAPELSELLSCVPEEDWKACQFWAQVEIRAVLQLLEE
ncbi:MAG: hypothetical protein OXF79_21035 [Chloroflexi bacterium]|nr:hypothetical protein [Chloroflexota bacterium]